MFALTITTLTFFKLNQAFNDTMDIENAFLVLQLQFDDLDKLRNTLFSDHAQQSTSSVTDFVSRNRSLPTPSSFVVSLWRNFKTVLSSKSGEAYNNR